MSKIPLTFTAHGSVNISFGPKTGFPADYSMHLDLKYSLNDGAWTTYTTKLQNIQLTNGDVLAFSGANDTINNQWQDNGFLTNGEGFVDVSGNIMSLINSEDTIPSAYCFNKLFFECKVVDASNLELPATGLTDSCYSYMFAQCRYLTSTPTLPAMDLASDCYRGMFRNCGELTNSPQLPATGLADSCYRWMFADCYRLTTPPQELPATTLAPWCYDHMFNNCSRITVPPVIDAVTTNSGCCCLMFSGCYSLTALPQLKFTGDIAPSACYSMFWGCSGAVTTQTSAITVDTIGNAGLQSLYNNCQALTSVPDLTAQTVGERGCAFMYAATTSSPNPPSINVDTIGHYSFYKTFGSAGLTAVPALDCVNLGTNCYNNMFEQCNSLSSVSLTLPATQTTIYCYDAMFINCTTLKDAIITVSGHSAAANSMAFMFAGCANLSSVVANFAPSSLGEKACRGMFENCSALLYTDMVISASSMGPSACYEMFIGCTNLTGAPTFSGTNFVGEYCFKSTFQNCHSLSTVDVGMLGATSLSPNCYRSMFTDCWSLTNSPDLPANTLATGCYQTMFNRCSSLIDPPALFAENVANQAYYRMFDGCASLNQISCSFTSWVSVSNMTSTWVNGVANNGTFYKRQALPDQRGTSRIPTNWNIKTIYYPISFSSPNDFSVKLNKLNEPNSASIQYKVDEGNWTSYTIGDIVSGKNISFRGEGKFSKNIANRYYFQIDSQANNIKVDGQILSLVSSTTIEDDYQFNSLFSGCTAIVDASQLVLNPLSATKFCYANLFMDCQNLTSPPVLSATGLDNWCYSSMFGGCQSLSSAPALVAMDLARCSYYCMFYGCKSLTVQPDLPATGLADWCYNQMFYGCDNLSSNK